MRSLQDALERALQVADRPQRIVSLVPSLTELLFDLGAGERVVGVSDFCTEPAAALGAGRCARVGGQKNPNLDQICDLKPDLVLAVKEENLRRHVDALTARGVPVYVADVRKLEDACALIGEIGDLVDADSVTVDKIHHAVVSGVQTASERAARHAPVTVFCPVWRDPWLSISADTFMYEVLTVCGARPLLIGDLSQRYPKVTLEMVRAARPQAILLPSEPYAFGESDRAELSSLAPTALVDGKLLMWYGARMAQLPALGDLITRLASPSSS